MDKNGFTLVELLASIVILALITTIATISYTSIIKENKIKQCEEKKLFIEKQAIKYASENNLLHNNSSSDLYISNLVCNGYLETKNNDWSCENSDSVIISEDDDVTNPITGKNFSGKITLKKENGLITAEYGVKCE